MKKPLTEGKFKNQIKPTGAGLKPIKPPPPLAQMTKEGILNGIKERLKGDFIPLFHKNGQSTGIGYHSKTKIVYRDIAHLIEQANWSNFKTEEEEKALNEIRRAERNKKEMKIEWDRFEKAKKIKYSDWTGEQIFWGDNFHPYDDIESLLDGLFDDLGSDYGLCPKYVWATKEVPYITDKDVFDVYERDLENLDPDHEWSVGGTGDLQTALDRFVERNKGNIAYWPDYSIALLIEDQIEEYRKQHELG